MTQKTVLFDFDGTIADTTKVLFELYNQFADEYGYDSLPVEDIEKHRSKSMKELIKEFRVPVLKLPALGAALQRELLKRLAEVPPIEGIRDALIRLSTEYQLAIVTSNSFEAVNEFLAQHDLEFFSFIHAEKHLFGKGHAIKKLLKQHQISQSDAVYVGDEIRDSEAAKAASIPFIAVTWGFNSEIGLVKVNPAAIARKPVDLDEAVRTVFKRHDSF